MTPEQHLWHIVRPKIPGHTVRIENILERGTPDVHVQYMGMSYWLELKVQQHAWPRIRMEQRSWAYRLAKEDGRVYMLSMNMFEIYGVWDISSCIWIQSGDLGYLETHNPPNLISTQEEISVLFDFIHSYEHRLRNTGN